MTITAFQSTFPRGERHFKGFSVVDGDIFQSTFPRGERPNGPLENRNLQKFQSTFPRGERLADIAAATGNGNFNPRSRVGNDTTTITRTVKYDPFQSTFPRGERPRRLQRSSGR